jgi:surfeit locus 1 family protein
LVPALSTLAMLAVLIGLGTWQVHRLAWKRGLLAEIAAAEKAPPVPLPPNPTPFMKVAVHGRLLADRTALYGAEVREGRAGPALGGQLIVPLERTGAPPLLVDLGWVPTERRASIPLPQGEVTIVGYVRPPDHPGWFSANDNPALRQFFTLDPQAIGAALGLSRVAPFTLIALGPAPPPGQPDPAHALPRPPNNHLQYAITWYGLAAALLVVFVVYAVKGMRA